METTEACITPLSEKVIAPEFEAFLKKENEFMQQHKNDTDEDLIRYIKACAAKLNHIPTKHELLGFTYIKSRLGPWPRVLEKAGLKQRAMNKPKGKKTVCCHQNYTKIQEKPD